MSTALHCDGPDCDEWVYTTDHEAADWAVVVVDGITHHFCTGWHLTRWGADNYEPDNEHEHDDQEQEHDT